MDGKAAPKYRPSFVRVVLENIECLAIAVVMALVLKYFLIEAYKIPTGSMQPTIMGDKHTQIFDRVLVNKMVYFFREPRRWEVIVFKMPLSQRQNYIKRLIGLPGEQITIRNGDIFVTQDGGDEEVARKPDPVWRSVRKRVFPRDPDNADYSRHFRGDASGDVAKDHIALRPAGDRPAQVAIQNSIVDQYYDGYDPKWIPASPNVFPSQNPASDLELVADVVPAGPARVEFVIREAGRVHRAALDTATGKLEILTTLPEEGTSVPGPEEVVFRGECEPIANGESCRVSFRNVDDELVLVVAGEEKGRFPYRTVGVDPRRDAAVEFQAEGSQVDLRDVEVFRDIHYTPDSSGRMSSQATFVVAPGYFFALGDNTQNSHDCRGWEKATYKLRDGREISGNWFATAGMRHPDANPKIDGDTLEFTNSFGETLRFPRADVLPNYPTREPNPLIPREFVLGKALAVFWPLPPFSPSWRLKWVR